MPFCDFFESNIKNMLTGWTILMSFTSLFKNIYIFETKLILYGGQNNKIDIF